MHDSFELRAITKARETIADCSMLALDPDWIFSVELAGFVVPNRKQIVIAGFFDRLGCAVSKQNLRASREAAPTFGRDGNIKVASDIWNRKRAGVARIGVIRASR